MRPRSTNTKQIPFRSGAADVLHNALSWEEHMIRMLIALLVLTGCAYVFFVGSSILNVMDRTAAEDGLARLKSAVSVLDAEYYTLTQGLAAARGKEFDLVPIAATEYVRVPGAVGVARSVQ